MDDPRTGHVDVRFSRPVHIVGVWSTPVLGRDALTGRRTGGECEGELLFSHSRKSLSFVGFLDRRGRRGADDYRRIQIGQTACLPACVVLGSVSISRMLE